MGEIAKLIERLNDWSDALDQQIEGDRAELLADAADTIAALKAQRDEAGQLAAELLEALKELLAIVEGECPGLLDADRNGFPKTDEIVRAAIAKAEAR